MYKDNTSNSEVSFSFDEDKRSDESRVSADGAGLSVNNGWSCSRVLFSRLNVDFLIEFWMTFDSALVATSAARSDTKDGTQKRQQEDLQGTKVQ